MRLRIGEILATKGKTAYWLAKQSGGRIGIRQAYRLAEPKYREIPEQTLAALCDVLEVEPGPLFARD